MRDALNALSDLISGRPLSRCLVIAEIGVNHDGDAGKARALLTAARESGADAVKFQIFDPDELCSSLHRAAEREMLRSYRLADADIADLCAFAAALGLPVLATPFDEPSLRLLVRLNIPVIKIGSGELTHTPFLAAAARTGRPIILSTGAGTWADVDRAVIALRHAGCERLSLLHCVSAYPPPDAQTHLRVIAKMAARYPACPIGFSDHSVGVEAAIAAVALGARIVEKHLTLDCAAAGPDHAASADPRMFAALVAAVRRTEALLGGAEKAVQPCEGTIGRSIVASRDLPAGHLLKLADVSFKRPGSGVRPYALDDLLERRTARAMQRDELIRACDLCRA